VHAILCIKERGCDTRFDEALEEGEAEAFRLGRIGRHGGRELVVIANENERLAAVDDWYDRRNLRRLRRLVYEDRFKHFLL
jgi:hypothetical protein